MKTHSRSLTSLGGLIAALTLTTAPALAVSLDYTFTGEFYAGSFLDATLLDGKSFEVHILTNTTVPDSDPGDSDRGEFSGPFTAYINIEGLGIFGFVNSVSMITEWTDAIGFQPVENMATFGGGSTSSMTGFSPDTITPFFGDPNLLEPFPGGANVVVADFNNEPVVALGTADVSSLSGQSPGGSVRATAIPDAGSSLILVAIAAAGFAGIARRRGSTGRRRAFPCSVS